MNEINRNCLFGTVPIVRTLSHFSDINTNNTREVILYGQVQIQTKLFSNLNV